MTEVELKRFKKAEKQQKTNEKENNSVWHDQEIQAGSEDSGGIRRFKQWGLND